MNWHFDLNLYGDRRDYHFNIYSPDERTIFKLDDVKTAIRAVNYLNGGTETPEFIQELAEIIDKQKREIFAKYQK